MDNNFSLFSKKKMMKNILKGKKGEGLNFNLAIGVVFSIMFFILLVVVVFLITTNLFGAGLLTGNRQTYSITNETGTVAQGKWINSTGYTLANANATTYTYTITQAFNKSGAGTVIPANNYSVTGAGIIYNTTSDAPYNNWNNVSISYTYQMKAPEEYVTDNLELNLTSGVNTIGNQFGTIFTIIAMLLVLVIIGVLIAVVSKFRNGGGSNFGQ